LRGRRSTKGNYPYSIALFRYDQSPLASHPSRRRRAAKSAERQPSIDVNSRQSWLAAHVPGALSLDPVGYDVTDLPAEKDSMLVFYCSNFMCRKAPNAARRAKGLGYRNVHVMSAGISGWLNASLSTESGDQRP
jgi:rhodanese-related sulfurtransferase